MCSLLGWTTLSLSVNKNQPEIVVCVWVRETLECVYMIYMLDQIPSCLWKVYLYHLDVISSNPHVEMPRITPSLTGPVERLEFKGYHSFRNSNISPSVLTRNWTGPASCPESSSTRISCTITRNPPLQKSVVQMSASKFHTGTTHRTTLARCSIWPEFPTAVADVLCIPLLKRQFYSPPKKTGSVILNIWQPPAQGNTGATTT